LYGALTVRPRGGDVPQWTTAVDLSINLRLQQAFFFASPCGAAPKPRRPIMATFFEARSRLVFRRAASIAADVVATISRSIRSAYTALNDTPHPDVPYAPYRDRENQSPELWILHAR
jgi:hypothetical protein